MFNKSERNKNIMRISVVSTIAALIHIIVQFLYRTLFLKILTKEYLGIEGLFSNVIQVLSLAELGIGTIISYKLYEPIQNNDTKMVASVMNFYRKIYGLVAMVVLVAGIALLPFMKFLVKDGGEIPSDVNFYFVYLLCLFQSVSSYFFAYKQTLLIADQKGDILALFTIGSIIFKTIVQMIILKMSKNYQLMFGVAILCGIVMNGLFSIYISRKYLEVWDKNAQIDKTLKKSIFSDIKAMLCHKIGGTALESTDNIVLSSFLGLGQLGIYSNYTMIMKSVKTILDRLLGNFTASIGNACLLMDKKQIYEFYEKLLIINHVIANIATVCIYILINPFIGIWQDFSMVFDINITILICICFFLNADRIISCSFTNACGLFTRDKFRPLIECFINVTVSILLTLKYGISGVCLGTVLSHFCTVGWREPYLLYKYFFRRKIWQYWFLYVRNVILMIIESVIIKKFLMLNVDSYIMWLCQSMIVFGVVVMVNAIAYRNLFMMLWKKMVKQNR